MPSVSLKLQETSLLVVDMQTKLLSSIPDHETITQRCLELVQMAHQLGMPIYFTEQYPQKLGKTLSSLKKEVSNAHFFEKKQFSATTPEFLKQLKHTSRHKVLVCGIETHVCVLQSCLNLINHGISTFLACDATGSGLLDEKEVAIRRLVQAGTLTTTTESSLFELVETADNHCFKSLQGIAKRRREVQAPSV